MAPPRVERLITAIDVGSSKIAVLIAGVTTDGTLHALGTGVRESIGVKRGYVVDIGAVDRSVRDALEMAERVAGVEVQQAWISFGAGNLSSRIVQHDVLFGGRQIDAEDIEDLHRAARDALFDMDRSVLHAQPAYYVLDGGAGVRNPEGFVADRFGIAVQLIEADPGPVSNLVSAVHAAHVDVREVVATALAGGLACLSAEQRDMGTALVDIGASLTSVALFAGGILVGLATIPSGGGDITDDIASQFGARRSEAERLKCFYGSAQSSPRDHQDQLEVGHGEDGVERPRITRAQLNAVIRTRLDHFTPMIADTLKRLGDGSPVGRQVVLTGGGAELKGMADYVQGVLGGSVRLARPTAIVGLPPAHDRQSFSTAIGLALHAAQPPADLRPTTRERPVDEAGLTWWRRLLRQWNRPR